MDLAYDNDLQGAFGLGWLFFVYVRINWPCRFRNRRLGGGELDSFAGGQVTEVFQIFFAGSSPTLLLPASLFETREYKSNFECWNGTNVWWAPVLFLTSPLPYPQYFD